jgi:hypothetical protein
MPDDESVRAEADRTVRLLQCAAARSLGAVRGECCREGASFGVDEVLHATVMAWVGGHVDAGLIDGEDWRITAVTSSLSELSGVLQYRREMSTTLCKLEPTGSQLEIIAAKARAPGGTEWCFDSTAMRGRVRLLWCDPCVGEIGGAYTDGAWWVEDADRSRRRRTDPGSASGYEGDLVSAMRRVLSVAHALGALDIERAARKTR